MAKRMRKAIVAGALGLAVLVPSATAVAQDRPPRDPNPPCYHQRDGHYGRHGHGGMHHGHYDEQGNWRHNLYDLYDEQDNWHHGNHGDRCRWEQQS